MMGIDYEDFSVVAVIDRYEFSKREHMAYSWHVNRTRMSFIVLIGAVIVFAIFNFDPAIGPIEIVGALATYFLVMSAILYVTMRRNVKRGRIQPVGSTGVVTIFKEGVRANINEAESWVPWSTLIGFRNLPFGVSLQFNSLAGFILPKRLFKSNDDWTRTLELIKGQLKPLK